MNFTWLIYALFASIAIKTASASEVVVYWGQGNGNEGPLRNYCTDSSIDIIVMAFVYEFPTAPGSSYPALNFAGHCETPFSSTDPYFLDCSASIGPDISYCQAQGKKIILSFGGAVGTYGFKSDAEAQSFADTAWNMFLGGSSNMRPFGSAVFDGVDLDIEAGSTTGYAAFITQLRSYFTAQTTRRYYISGAPQCVYPDYYLGPGTGTALQNGWFDYLWVQFYNNYCGLNAYPSQFNYATWATWASTISKNPDVKLIIGAPGSPSSAGSGYVSATTLQVISNAMAAAYPKNFGGIMLWAAGTSTANGNFAGQLSFLHSGSSTPVITPVSTPPTAPSTPSSPTTPVSKTSTSTSGATKTSTSTSTSGKPVKTTTTTTTTGKPVKTTTTTTGKAKSTSTSGRTATGSTSTSTSASSPVISSPTVPTPTPTPVPVPVPTPVPAPVSTPTPAPPTNDAGSACASNGWMKCASSNTYQICNWGTWTTPQSCSTGLKCSPDGDYIYCTY